MNPVDGKLPSVIVSTLSAINLNRCPQSFQSAPRSCSCAVNWRRRRKYERLSARATELRRPARRGSDRGRPPIRCRQRFSATLGRLLPIGGAEGVALLLTMVVELMSCFGLAGLVSPL